MHQIKDFFFLAADLHADLFFTDPGKFVCDDAERFLGLCDIYDHHHIEISVYDGLGDIKDIDLVLRKICADACNDADGVFSYNCDDSSLHIFILFEYCGGFVEQSFVESGFVEPCFVGLCFVESEFNEGGRGASFCHADRELFGAVACIREQDFHPDGLKCEFREVVFLAEVAKEYALQMII